MIIRKIKAITYYVFRYVVGKLRIMQNMCPECNSDAPAIDTCSLCGGRSSAKGYSFPPSAQLLERYWNLYHEEISKRSHYLAEYGAISLLPYCANKYFCNCLAENLTHCEDAAVNRSKIIVRDKEHLRDIIKHCNEYADLNNLDVSLITDMSGLFMNDSFNGLIDEWDVGNVVDMSFMFYNSEFDGNISDWDVGNVIMDRYMFFNSRFTCRPNTWPNTNNLQVAAKHDIIDDKIETTIVLGSMFITGVLRLIIN